MLCAIAYPLREQLFTRQKRTYHIVINPYNIVGIPYNKQTLSSDSLSFPNSMLILH